MNAIRLNAECLRISVGEEIPECLEAIESACDQMVALVERLDAMPDEDPAAEQSPG